MAQTLTKWQKFKRFLKRNMTPTWAAHFGYQVVAFFIAIAMVAGVATYAFTKTYEEMELNLVEGFTLTAHSGAFNTVDNSLENIQAVIDNKVQVCEFDLRLRPDGTIVLSHDLLVTSNDGVELATAFEMLKGTGIYINLDIKETRVLTVLDALVAQYDMYDWVFLTGIETYQTDDVKRYCPNISYYLNYIPHRLKIFTSDYQQKLIATLEESGAVGINCNYKYAGGKLSEVLHNNGYKLSVWTVDKESTIKRMLIIEPDNITTRKYAEIINLINNW